MRIRDSFVPFCVPTAEVSFVRFDYFLRKSKNKNLMREGIFNCILYYLYVYQKILMAGSQHLRNLSLVTGFLQSPSLPRRLLFLLCFGIHL